MPFDIPDYVYRHFDGANILIAGGSGSIGQALSKELLSPAWNVRRLACLARKWQPLAQMERDFKDPRFRPLIGDVRDLERLRIAFREVDYIIHAAALKGIDFAAYNPTEAVATNVLGTQNVLHAAMENQVAKILVISTDKAANAISMYGASKKCAEALAVGFNAYSSRTRSAAARYGNVLGSSGSVLPFFRQQAPSGTLSVTSPKMTRFWLRIEDAAKYLMRCLYEMQGGEVYVPHLPASTIDDLARAVAPEARIQYVGIRPAEKMHEVMIADQESRNTVDQGWSYLIKPDYHPWDADAHWSGLPVPEGWQYISASAQRLTVSELESMCRFA